MGTFRGSGTPGVGNDVYDQDDLDTAVAAAAASEAAAAASETAASASETAASGSASAAATSESNAGTSETNAAASEAAAAVSESNASDSQLAAAVSAANAAASESAAADSESNAADSEAAAAASEAAAAGAVTYENLSTNGDVGTGATQVAQGNHTHAGVYEPADATILKDADIGSTVQSYDADTAKLDAAQSWSGKQTFAGDVAMSSQFAFGGSGYIASPTSVLALPTNTNSVYLGGSGALVVNYIEDQTPGADYIIAVGNHATTFKHNLGAPGTGEANIVTFTGADLTVPAYSTVYGTMSTDGNSFTLIHAKTTQSKVAAIQTPTKGSTLIGDGTYWSPLAVGTNDYVLTADSAESTGTKWAAASGMKMFAAESLGISYQKTRSLSGTVERIEVAFAGVSVNSSREIVIALGTGGSLTRSGYSSEAREEVTPTATYGATGFIIFPVTGAGKTHSGVATLVHLGSNVWTISGSCYEDTTSNIAWFGGNVTLAGACNIVGIGIESGSSTDTSTHFDAGTWKVSYQTS